MTTSFTDKPLLRPRRVTRGSTDELLHRISRQFVPSEIELTTSYPVPARRRNENSSHVTVSATTIDELLDDQSIAQVVTHNTVIELTNLTITAQDTTRRVCIAITRHGVQGRSREYRLALEGHRSSWRSLWRSSRCRGFTALGLALDAVLLASLHAAGLELLHTPLGATLLALALVLVPTASCLIGHRFTHRCHVRIGKNDPVWFWHRWTTSERIAFATLLVALITWATGFLANTSRNEVQPPAPTHSTQGR
jgi:hypothetical protein